jgi:hypothetical protein
VQEDIPFASLTDIIYKTWAGKTAKEYKKFKGLKKENLRDSMTNKELAINMLAELSTKEISETSDPKTMTEHEDVARRGGNIAREARLNLKARAIMMRQIRFRLNFACKSMLIWLSAHSRIAP